MKVSMAGTGRVHYFSGYDLTIDKMDIAMDTTGFLKYICDLGLQDGRYKAPLTIVPGVNLMAPEKLGAKDLILSGPILFNAETVGYFEVMGDDGIVIRDAAKNIVHPIAAAAAAAIYPHKQSRAQYYRNRFWRLNGAACEQNWPIY